MRQFYKERDVVLEERRMRYEDDPGGKLYELLLGIAYLRHPYRMPVIGYESDINSLTATKLNEFRRKYYDPSNMVVSLVGRIDPDKDIKVVEEYFGSLPTAPTPDRSHIAAEAPSAGEKRVALRTAASPQVIVSYAKPNYPHADDPAITVLSEILAGGHVSPLYTELVKKRQLAADIGSDEGPGVAYPNQLMFVAPVKAPSTTEQVVDAFDAVVNRFKKHGPTHEQLEIAKRGIGVEYLDHLRSNQSLALDFASSELVYGSWKASVEWYEKMLQVTLDDVKRVSAIYLVPERRTIATIERAQ
jgi:predicted Zn-dependent peptidase